MMNNSQSPREYHAVLGGNSPLLPGRELRAEVDLYMIIKVVK